MEPRKDYRLPLVKRAARKSVAVCVEGLSSLLLVWFRFVSNSIYRIIAWSCCWFEMLWDGDQAIRMIEKKRNAMGNGTDDTLFFFDDESPNKKVSRVEGNNTDEQDLLIDPTNQRWSSSWQPSNHSSYKYNPSNWRFSRTLRWGLYLYLLVGRYRLSIIRIRSTRRNKHRGRSGSKQKNQQRPCECFCCCYERMS